VVDRLGAVGSGVLASAGPATALLGPSLLVLPIAGLDHLAARVVDLTATLGEPPPLRPFSGHVTLARAKRGVRVGHLAGASLSATWPVCEVTLVASDLHPEGARYSTVAHFPLNAGGPVA
jgi:RNA 2',3'-cyclic 3'-phosphodiesterase